MKKAVKNIKKPLGRPKKKLDRKQINKYIDQQLSIRAIAEIVGVAPQTIINSFKTKLQKRKNADIITRVGLRQQLREAQWNSAIKGKNTAMMIWLGKNELGQADKIETTEMQERKGMKVTHG